MQHSQNEKMLVKVHFSTQFDNEIRKSEQIEIPVKKIEPIQNSEINMDYSDEIQQQKSSEQINKILEKLVNYIRFHCVNSQEIWRQRKEIKISEFVHLFSSNYAYNFSNQQTLALQKIVSKKNYLRSRDFQRFDIWNQQPKSITRLLSSCNLKKSRKSLPNNQRSQSPKQTFNTWFNDESKIQSQQNQKPKFHIQKQSVKFSLKSKNNFNQQTFEDAKKYSEDKVRLKVQQLKKDIKQSVLQKKWDFIVMAGEMNQWIDMLKKQAQKQVTPKEPQNIFSYRYKIVNKDPVEIIQQNTDFGTQQQIPHVVFVKKYQTLKKRMVKQENHKNNLKGTVMMVLEDNDKLNKNNLNNRINQRDQELNFVLLQIMRMKSLFQWQNSLLKQAKINS